MTKKSSMIDTFWVETSVRHANQCVTQISAGETGVQHEIAIENCSGFPADVTISGEFPQASTGIEFRDVGTEWTGEARRMLPNETRAMSWEIQIPNNSTGSESIHASIKQYVDRCANSTHTPNTPNTLFINLTIY